MKMTKSIRQAEAESLWFECPDCSGSGLADVGDDEPECRSCYGNGGWMDHKPRTDGEA